MPASARGWMTIAAPFGISMIPTSPKASSWAETTTRVGVAPSGRMEVSANMPEAMLDNGICQFNSQTVCFRAGRLLLCRKLACTRSSSSAPISIGTETADGRGSGSGGACAFGRIRIGESRLAAGASTKNRNALITSGMSRMPSRIRIAVGRLARTAASRRSAGFFARRSR